MFRYSGCFTAAVLASALAVPTIVSAAPPQKPGGNAPVVHAAPRGGGAPHFTPHATPHFTPRAGGAPHFTTRSTSVPHFTTRSAHVPRFTTRSIGTSHVTRHVTPRVTHRTTTANRNLRLSHPNLTTGHSNLTTGSIPRHERIRRGREQHNLVHQAAPNAIQAKPSLATAPSTREHSGLHHNKNGISTQTARQGRFASAFAARAQSDPKWRSDHAAARRAWRHHHRAGFVAWYGPVFWPYAYSDIFDYAFWPYGYDDGYWAYAYDDFIDGLFWGEYGPPEDYAYAYAPPRGSHAVTPRVSYAGVEELCKQPGTGITAWPFADIQRKVGLDDEQKQLLAEVKKAAADAAATFKASCPSEKSFPLTPPGRLAAMTGRLQATLEAVNIVQPALDRFYNALNDEQKERFNQLGPRQQQNSPETTAALPPDNKSCREAKPGLASLPIEKIGEVVKPTDAQQANFKALQDATEKAVSILQEACPDETPLTPPGRLEAMKTRLQAMVAAANAVKPPLDSFYASLSNEQKARFDRIGQVLARANE
jgi:hypothetical protein